MRARPIWKTGAELGLPDVAAHGLTSEEISRLASYNTERSHGLMHTTEYAEKMAELQKRFDEASQ